MSPTPFGIPIDLELLDSSFHQIVQLAVRGLHEGGMALQLHDLRNRQARSSHTQDFVLGFARRGLRISVAYVEPHLIEGPVAEVPTLCTVFLKPSAQGGFWGELFKLRRSYERPLIGLGFLPGALLFECWPQPTDLR